MNWRFEIYETLSSTSVVCRQRAEAGEASGLVLLAHRQGAARGSRGRSWTSGEGNLAFSFLIVSSFLDVSSDPSDAMHGKWGEFVAVLPFLTGLAVYEAFVALSVKKATGFQLKWPNDLLLHQRKMAGMLIETGFSIDGNAWAVVGVGANLRQAPVIEGRELASFSELGFWPSPETCASLILEKFDDECARWRKAGREAVYDAWCERAHPLGTPLAVRGRDTYMSGRFRGLDEQGRLLLARDNGDLVSVVTGEVLCL